MSRVTAEAAQACEFLDGARRILVTSHMSPDGDALGSELAFAELARALGCSPVIVNRDAAGGGVGELPGAEQVRVAAVLPDDFPGAFDLVVTLECPGLDRPGLDGLDRLPILNVDHHKANDRYGELNYLDEAAPAVGEMVWRMFGAAGVRPSRAAATAMFMALSTDTGDFRYANATPRAFRAAADMVEAGADPAQVAEWVHQRRSPASVRLLGEALRHLELRCDGRIAAITVGPDAFEHSGADPADTDGLINIPRAITGVEIAVFFKQHRSEPVRVSLRSKGAIDVRSVAAELGGGGHTNAAGCSVNSRLKEAREDVLRRLELLLGGSR